MLEKKEKIKLFERRRLYESLKTSDAGITQIHYRCASCRRSAFSACGDLGLSKWVVVYGTLIYSDVLCRDHPADQIAGNAAQTSEFRRERGPAEMAYSYFSCPVYLRFRYSRLRLVARNGALCCHANGAKHEEQGENDVLRCHDMCELCVGGISKQVINPLTKSSVSTLLNRHAAIRAILFAA